MTIDTNAIISVTEANQNFSHPTRIAEKNGQAVIFKSNRPRYLLIDLDAAPMLDLTDDSRSVERIAAKGNGVRYPKLSPSPDRW